MVKLPTHVVAVSKAKSSAQTMMAYVGRYLEGVPTVYDERVPTMAVDDVGRLYINPNWCLQWSEDQNGYVLLHEMSHNLLGHAERRMDFLPNPTEQDLEDWNTAADISVQQLLKQFDQHRPGNSVRLDDYLHLPGMTSRLSTERMFTIIRDNRPKGGGGGCGGGKTPGNPGNSAGGGGNDDGQQDGDGGGQQGTDSQGSGDGESNGGKGKGKGRKQPHGASGSASDGIPQPYELPRDLTSVGSNLARLEELRQELEKDPTIAIGSGAGTLKAELNVRLRPQPDPFDQLKSIVGQFTAAPIGVDEPTYRKRSRRQECDDLPIPGILKMAPECVIIVDTSGSMGNPKVSDRAARAMTAIAQGLRRCQNPRVIAWDGNLQSDKRVSSIRQFQWQGGGGTSMDEAVVMVDQKYRPDAIVLVTDCGTAWPDKPTRSRLIVAMVDKYSTPPKWARSVDLTKEVNSHVG